MDRRVVIGGLSIATEFSVIVLFFIFLGYSLGKEFSKNLSTIGMLIGSFLGLVLGVYHLSKKV